MSSIKKNARIAGLMYLMFMAMTFLADRFACFTPGDPKAIVLKIMANEWLFRIGCISGLVSAAFFLLVAWTLYILLKPVNKNSALLFLLSNSVGAAIYCLSILNLIAGMLLLSGAGFAKQFQADQLQAHAEFFIDLYNNGFLIADIFYGIWLLPLGFSVFKSRFLPKFLSLLLVIDFFAVLTWVFQLFLFPDHKAITNTCLMVSLITEASLTLWLLIMGANDKKSTFANKENGGNNE
jgi:hypothetical protein